MITFDLPYPPSANRLWRAVRGRNIKSAEYRAWLVDAQASITRACIAGSMEGRYHLEISALAPDRRHRDIDNLIKPISDAIAAAGLVMNDAMARSVFIQWGGEPVKGGSVNVTLRGA